MLGFGNKKDSKKSSDKKKKPAAKSPKILVDDLSNSFTDINTDDLEIVAKKIYKELEGLPEKKPLLTALGAFAIGFMIGRSR